MKNSCILKKTIFNTNFLIYLITGLWNTIFGYAIYASLTYIFDIYNIFSYIYAYILSNIISITQAFFMHKYIVFRSKGNLLTEYKRCWIVYGATLLLTVLLLPLCVSGLSLFLPLKYQIYNKYIGGIIVTGIAAIISFIGHQKITFRK